MTDFDYGGPVDGGEEPRKVQVAGFVNWIGALTSVALIAGMGVWGYKLLVRDVTGVPVVRALEGPMRITPEDPGGSSASYQGLAVNRVTSEGEAEPPAERLVLAPKPIVLTDEDQPVKTDAPEEIAAEDETAQAEAEAEIEGPVEGPSPEEDVAEAGVADTPEDALPTDLAVAEALAGVELEAEATPLSGELEDEPQFKIIPASVPGVSRSPRPVARPQVDLAALSVASNVAATAEPEAELDVSADTIEVGTRLVQLGAFESSEVAKSEWDKLAGNFGDYLEGKNRVIQKANSGGKTFYRLRAMGFEDLSDARRFCSALLAENAACIPVVTR